jgi:hypothetical protein
MTNVPVIPVCWDFVSILKLAVMTIMLVLLIPAAHSLVVSIQKEIVMITMSAPMTIVAQVLDAIQNLM